MADISLLTSAYGAIAAQRFGYEFKFTVVDGRGVPVNPLRLGYVLRLLAALKKAWAPNDYTIVHSGTPYFYDYVPALVFRMRSRAKPRLVVNLPHMIPRPWERHGARIANLLAWLEQRFMIQIVRHSADVVIADNPEVCDQLVRRGVPSERVILIRMGVFAKVDPYADGDRTFDAVYVGRFARTKGTHTLLNAWTALVRAMPNAKLALIGRNEVDFDVQKEIASLGLADRVQVFESLTDVQLLEVLRRSRLFVTASLEEGYGLSVLEAMAAGLPCVTFDIPAFRFAFPQGRLAASTPTADGLARALNTALTDSAVYQRLEREVQSAPIQTWDQASASQWNELRAACA